MVRAVKAELEAGVTKYVPPIDEAARSTDNLDDKIQKTNRDLDKVPPASARAAASMKLLGAEADQAKLKLNDTGHGASTALEALDQKLIQARMDMRKFADEFNRTGDTTALSKFNKAKQDVEDLERLGKDLAAALTAAAKISIKTGVIEGSKEGFKEVGATLQGFLSTPVLGPIIATLVAGVVAAAIPMIGAALNLGGGLGIIGAGIAAQFQDAQVKSAATSFVSTLKSMFLDATSSFRNPVENALLDLTNFTRHLDLRSIFQPLAQDIAPLEQGLEGFLSRVVGGLGKFSESLQPVMFVFEQHLPQFGAIIESFLQRISRNAGENASALDMLLTILEQAVRLTGALIEAFDHFYKFAVNVALGVAIAFDKAFGWAPIVGKHLDDNVLTLARMAAEADGAKVSLDNTGTAADGLNGAIGPNGLGKSVLGTAQAFDQLDQATLTWKNDALDAKNASLQFKDGLANLKDQLKQNGAGFDENTTAGRQNIEALNQLATSAQDVADKTYAATGNSQAAAQAYAQARDQVLDLAKKGHASADELNALNTALDNVVKIRKGSVEIDVSLTGSGKALVTNQGTTLLGGSGIKLRRWGGIDYAADGLIGLSDAKVYPAMSRPTYGFAEPGTGAEGFVPRFGDYNRSTAIIDQEAKWYGGRFVPSAVMGGPAAAPVVNVVVSPKDGALGALVDLIDVRVEHGNQRTAAAVSGGVRV
jgi:hypothetical protein